MTALAALVCLLFALARTAVQWRRREHRSRSWYLGWIAPGIAALLAAALSLPSLLVAEKLVGALVEPIGLVWLALIVLTVVAAVERRWRWCMALALVCLLDTAAGNAWVGGWLMRSLERGQADPPPPASPYDCLVVLGGGADVTPSGQPELRDGGDRVVKALTLYHQGWTHLLVATGSAVPGMEHAHETGSNAAAIWQALGVPAADILVLREPTTTSAEIRAVADEAARRGWHRIALCTSAWHLPRALRLCRDAGLTVTPIPCDWCGHEEPWSLVWVVPHGACAERVQQAVWEYLAAIAGR